MNTCIVDLPEQTRKARVDVVPERRATRRPQSSLPPRTRSWPVGKLLLLALIAAGAVGAATVWYAPSASSSHGGPGLEPTDKLVFHTMHRADLPITVTERGTLASQREIKVVCELETVPGQYGTRILWIVPNGTAVKKGDLLVEFDAAPLRDRLTTQKVVYEQAKAARRQAELRFDNQQSQNDTNLDLAKIRLDLAKLSQQMYEDKGGGTYRISMSDLDAKILESKNQIKEDKAGLRMKAARLNGVETLYKLGYRAKGDRDQAIHDHLQADFLLVKATNALATAEANREKLKEYEYPMKVLEFKSAIKTAQRALDQAERDNKSLLEQALAVKVATERALATEEEKLNRFTEQLAKAKVYAPEDGLVAHSPDRTPWGKLVADGEIVTERFKILSLPDLTSMQVKLSIHESVQDQVKAGLVGAIRIDSFPDDAYHGTVRSVAVLPTQDGNMSSDVKVYDVIVTIDEQVSHLKPGMTAVVDIHINRLHDVLSVPVQAIMQEEDETWCYVEGTDGLERRDLKLGVSNDSNVQVLEGLLADERVVLNPTAVAVTGQPEPSPDATAAIHSRADRQTAQAH